MSMNNVLSESVYMSMNNVCYDWRKIVVGLSALL